MKPIKIISYNTYLIASRFNKNRETHPRKRATKICRDFFLSSLPSSSKSQDLNGKEADKNDTRPDLCFFQEGWYPRIAAMLNSMLKSIQQWISYCTVSLLVSDLHTIVHIFLFRDAIDSLVLCLEEITSSSCVPLDHTFPNLRSINLLFPLTLYFVISVWGSGISELTNSTFYSFPPRRSSLFSSIVSSILPSVSDTDSFTNQNIDISSLRTNTLYDTMKEMVDTFNFYWQSTGGLYDVSDPSMACLYRSKHTFSVSRSKSKKGVEATLWSIPKWDKHGGKLKTQLLVFNTHLDPWHEENRRKQILEIMDFMQDTLQSIEREAMASRAVVDENAARSICEENEETNNIHDWSRTAVLVLGDFNIKAGSEEYWETVRLLESTSVSSNSNHGWKDFFLLPGETDDNVDQHTYAVANSLAEYPEDCGRIDYVFGVQSFVNPKRRESGRDVPQKQGTSRMFMPLKEISRSIRKEPTGVESSDHYALILEVIPAV